MNGKGVTTAFFAYVFWGFLPVYWKLLDGVVSEEILAHRIIWSFVFVMLLISLTSGYSSLKHTIRQLRSNGRMTLLLLLSSIFISLNWFVYIWAVNHNQVLATSLGYYINPLISVGLGFLFLRERMTKVQSFAVGVAAVGVGFFTVSYGEVPWVSLLLALSFGFYALTKKLTKLSTLQGLLLETFFVVPIAIVYEGYSIVYQQSSFYPISLNDTLLLIGGGIVTAIPLLLFSKGAQTIPLYMIGILQYTAPTIAFLLGIFVYNEPFTKIELVTFSLIWIAVVVFLTSQFREIRKVKLTKEVVQKV
ncbi:EamA family transporter RarD [Bacillus carboniphilus]|uniref:EamA family transporter RarD n=1 Tax=Bacillus carboniphilus TaxID=86663 RepID=A0ABY9JVB5_9BACI|nr:EamA family transporter RarD [Bacillus carboniphilus]WLR43342.1 EamA family transporter RarD [Bacillus carboniphilus]